MADVFIRTQQIHIINTEKISTIIRGGNGICIAIGDLKGYYATQHNAVLIFVQQESAACLLLEFTALIDKMIV
jgi:hypothetical protein